MSNGLGDGSVQTVSSNGDPASFKIIADGATHPPKLPKGALFDDFYFRMVAIDKATVFRGVMDNLQPNVDGIYSRGDGGFFKLVDNNTSVPGGVGDFQFGQFFGLAASNGVVVFGGVDAAGNVGLYAVPENGGNITKIVATGDPIGNGFTVTAPSVGKQPLNGNHLVFRVGYADPPGGAGMYSTNMSLQRIR